MDELDLPNFFSLKATKLVDGKIVAISREEMWSEWWKNEENRRKTMALPGFDAKIFKECTGIDINE